MREFLSSDWGVETSDLWEELPGDGLAPEVQEMDDRWGCLHC